MEGIKPIKWKFFQIRPRAAMLKCQKPFKIFGSLGFVSGQIKEQMNIKLSEALEQVHCVRSRIAADMM